MFSGPRHVQLTPRLDTEDWCAAAGRLFPLDRFKSLDLAIRQGHPRISTGKHARQQHSQIPLRLSPSLELCHFVDPESKQFGIIDLCLHSCRRGAQRSPTDL